jgi:uncharacterized protein YjbJ (UPF0337 family)
MEDENIVQEGAVSEETASTSEETLPEGEGTEKPLTRAEIKEMIGEVTESAKREIQSAKDRARAEVEHALGRAKLAEESLAGMEKGFRDIDPEATESSKEKAELAFYRKQARIAKQRQAAMAHHQKFVDNLKQFIVESGVDVNDKRIDWGSDAKDYYEVQRRVLTSVGKIQKEGAKAETEKANQKAKDLEDAARKETDSVNTSMAAGGVGRKPNRKEIIKRFGEGDPTISRADYEKAMNER